VGVEGAGEGAAAGVEGRTLARGLAPVKDVVVATAGAPAGTVRGTAHPDAVCLETAVTDLTRDSSPLYRQGLSRDSLAREACV